MVVLSADLEVELPVIEVEVGYHCFGVGLGCTVELKRMQSMLADENDLFQMRMVQVVGGE